MVASEPSTIAQTLKIFDLTVSDGQMILVAIPVFIVLWLLLDKNFFTPYLRLAEKRESATQGAQDLAARNNEKAAELSEQYESALLAERIKAVEAKMQRVAAAKNMALEIVDKAQRESQEAVKKARTEIAAHITQLEQETSREAQKLAELITNRIKQGGASGHTTIQ